MAPGRLSAPRHAGTFAPTPPAAPDRAGTRQGNLSMRRSALLGLICLLGGCQFAGSPFDGFGGFISDTHTFSSNPNLPPGSDETMQRVEDKPVTVAPLTPEAGNIWPGPMKEIPTMQDLQQMNMRQLPPPNIPAAPPPMLFKNELPNQSGAATQVYPAHPAPVIGHTNPNGVKTYTAPGGGQGIIVPNANGTSTLIGPDGSIQTVPTPK